MIAEIFQKISVWIIVIPFLIGLANFKNLNRDSKWIFLLVVLALPPQALTGIINQETPLLHFSYNVYIVLEFTVLYFVFSPKYKRLASLRLVQGLASLFVLVYIAALFTIGIEKRFLNEVLCAANLIYLVWILLLLKQEFSEEETIIEWQNPFTWYLIAILLFAPCTIATFALYHYIRVPSPMRMSLTIINSVFNILLYLLFSVGLILQKPDFIKNI